MQYNIIYLKIASVDKVDEEVTEKTTENKTVDCVSLINTVGASEGMGIAISVIR